MEALNTSYVCTDLKCFEKPGPEIIYIRKLEYKNGPSDTQQHAVQQHDSSP